MTRRAAGAQLGDDGEDQILAAHPMGQAPIHCDAHGLGLGLQQRLRRQHMAHFGGADAKRQSAERAMGGGVAVAADNGHARLGQTQLRADHMDDAAVGAVPTRQANAMAAAVILERLHLLFRRRIDIDRLGAGRARRCGRGMIQRAEHPVRSADFQPALFERGEGLRACHFMDEVQVDIDQRGRRIGLSLDLVCLPDLLEKGFGGSVRRRRRFHDQSPQRERVQAPASPNHPGCGLQTIRKSDP